MNVEVLRGSHADSALNDASFVAGWEELAAGTPWLATFQSPSFCLPWYRAYRSRHEPVIITGTRDGRLVGLLPLALSGDDRLMHAGDHQCEYQGWLAVPGADDFGGAAIGAALEFVGSAAWHWAHVAPGLPGDALTELAAVGAQIEITTVGSPLLDATDEEFRAGKARGRLRSHRNHFERRGLRYERVRDPALAERVLDRLATWCDLRQGAAHDVMPFTIDPDKLDFHRGLLQRSDSFWLSALWLGDDLLAAHLGPFDGTELALGLQAYDPREGRRSPGAILLLELAADVARAGGTTLDLTPGGDAWKERYASHHRNVHGITLRRSRIAAAAARAGRSIENLARRCLKEVGADPAAAGRRLRSLRGGKVTPDRDAAAHRGAPFEISDPSRADGATVTHPEDLDRLVVQAAAGLDADAAHRLLGRVTRYLAEGWRPWTRAEGDALTALAFSPPDEGWIDLEGPSDPRCRRDPLDESVWSLPDGALLVVPLIDGANEAPASLAASVAGATGHDGPVWIWLEREAFHAAGSGLRPAGIERRAG